MKMNPSQFQVSYQELLKPASKLPKQQVRNYVNLSNTQISTPPPPPPLPGNITWEPTNSKTLLSKPEQPLEDPPVAKFEFKNSPKVLPKPPKRPSIVMIYPSHHKKLRKQFEKVTGFAETAKLPISVKLSTNILKITQSQELYSCPKLRTQVSDLEKMAKLLANHLTN